MTAADVQTWIDHWNDRRGGGLTFTFTDPRTATTVTCRFDTTRMGNLGDIIQRTGPVTYDIGPVHLEEAL